MPAFASSAVVDALSRAALERMEQTLPWYGALPAQQRSWVAMVAQAGVRSFLTWLANPVLVPTVTSEVFGAAPRELTRAVSLRQTLDLVRTVVTVIEENSGALAADAGEASAGDVQAAVLRFSREVAFSAAEIYAQAAEMRATWDTRLEAVLVDALIRDDPDDFLESRFSMLGWRRHPHLAVVAGRLPVEEGELSGGTEALRSVLCTDTDDALVGVHGEALVAVIGTDGPVWDVAHRAVDRFGPGPLVVGPTVRDLPAVRRSAAAALAGLAAAPGLPDAPRPVLADDLLPERALLGDPAAVGALVGQVHHALGEAGPGLRETISAFLDSGGSLEGTARALFVHANTVRYRLRRVADLTGWDATSPRDAFILRVGLTLGRLADATL